MNRLQILLSILCTSLYFAVCCAQGHKDQKEHYLFFDGITGIENSDLHNGIIYKEEHRVKNQKTKFFPQPDFVLGSVVFDGLPYFDIPLKYNVYDDELLMLVEKEIGGNTLQLYKIKVNSFEIEDYNFRKIEDPGMPPGFYEVVFESQRFSLLKKHRKNIRQLLGEKQVYYEFEEAPGKNYLLRSNKYHEIKNTKELISFFPEYIEVLKSYEGNEESSLDLKGLLEYLNSLMSNKNKKKKGN